MSPENDQPQNDQPENDQNEATESAIPEPENPKCGFVALVGAPNAGKSTLLNALVGAKLSIVSPKVQTTRSRVLGIATEGDAQILYVDTPGIFKPKRRLDRAMVAAAWQGAGDADMVVLLNDVTRKSVDEDTANIVQRLKEAGRQAILVLNKIDQVPREKLLARTAELHAHGIFTDVFMISALNGDGVDDLRRAIVERLPAGHWLYPGDQLSDMPLRLIAAEITREKLFLQLHDELPYETTVETEGWEEFDNGSVKISLVVYVQRDTQKAIVLGKGGRRIKEIGAAARAELETFLERRVHLMLFVKVREDWAEDPERYRDLGLDYNA